MKASLVKSTQTCSTPDSLCPDTLGLITQASGIGNEWLVRLSRFDRRRAAVQEMNSRIADMIAARDDSSRTLDAVRTMLCANCSKLHPGLATLCDLQPESSVEKLDRCWLMKGSRCNISRQWKISPIGPSLTL